MRGALEQLRWLRKRARLMSAREVLHRLSGLLDLQVLRASRHFGAGLCAKVRRDPGQFGFCTSVEPCLPPLQWRPLESGAVERALDGSAGALGFPWRWRDEPEVWHMAPDTGKLWPQRFFADIPYRSGNPYGDARVVWEPARLQQLVVLALAAREGSAEQASRAVRLIERVLASWVASNPPLTGVHYISAMECALRIVAACHAIDMTRARLPASSEVWGLLPGFIDCHARLIARRLSLHSSRGNHTIAECAGLIYAATLFPELPRAKAWRRVGLRWLSREAERQILPDGGGIEQAFWYHLFVVDLCGLVLAALRRYGEEAPPGLASAVERGRRFLAAFADHPESLPDIGDRDGGYALSPYLAISWSPRPHSHPVLSFPQSGYTRISLGEDPGTYIVFDHGPLGMPPAYGHGHADALSLTFVLANEPVLIDPGTYCYSFDPSLRGYFRGTRAHNTVVVDGADQARQETAFQWSSPCRAELAVLERWPDGGTLAIASHDGYRRAGVTHWRAVLATRAAGFVVWDLLCGTGVHDLHAHWHCGVPLMATNRGNFFVLGAAKARLSIHVDGAAAEIAEGARDPLSGWHAPQYGVKQPIQTLRLSARSALPHLFNTRIRFDGGFAPLENEREALRRLEIAASNGAPKSVLAMPVRARAPAG